ncbi:MAG: DUF2844 domain-containing protein [Acidobacteriia bacterium]|nr:DUF2844 domain-containing protein [Terriglobia bacterium]
MKTVVGVLLALVLGAAPTWATLGEYEASVSSDQQYLRGKLQTTPRQGYTLHRIASADGTVVREYISPAGLVFGISWQSVTMPNLRQLMGSYYAQFQQASQSRVRRRGPFVVRTDQLVVESGGHMRAFHGRAYVPNLLPKNIPPEVVQ